MQRIAGVFVLIALGIAGLATGVLAASGADGPGTSHAVFKVTVAASEFKFVLSKRSVPIGTVVFTVVNKGKLSHNFKIAGKSTRNLLPGHKATLTVKFSKKGPYAYLCTIPGHAAAGMKGIFSVKTKPGATPPPTTTQKTATTTPPPTGTVGTTASTVQVEMFEYRFDLSPADGQGVTSVPSGPVTFVITNKGTVTHSFSIVGVHTGALLPPGGTETYTVGLPRGRYTYRCDVPSHSDRGMEGFLGVEVGAGA